jgi:3'(2'), 5'-bisphosphate nucleotidase
MIHVTGPKAATGPNLAAVEDELLAVSLAEQAGALLTSLRVGSATIGVTGIGLAERGLHESRELLVKRLSRERPGDTVISDTDPESLPLHFGDRVWVLDPLDGAEAFGCPPRSDWTVNVALWERGRGITAAAISKPLRGGVYSAARPPALDREALDGPKILVVDAYYVPDFAAALCAHIGAALHMMDSAGARTMAVLHGDVDGYLHRGDAPGWDAGPLSVARAAGLSVTPLEGAAPDRSLGRRTCTDHLVCSPSMELPLLHALGWIGATG